MSAIDDRYAEMVKRAQQIKQQGGKLGDTFKQDSSGNWGKTTSTSSNVASGSTFNFNTSNNIGSSIFGQTLSYGMSGAIDSLTPKTQFMGTEETRRMYGPFGGAGIFGNIGTSTPPYAPTGSGTSGKTNGGIGKTGIPSIDDPSSTGIGHRMDNGSSGSTTAGANTTVIGAIGTTILGGLLGKMFNKITGEKEYSGDISYSQSPIDLPGTIVGNLKNVQSTQAYIQNFARYNNYLTCNLGMAQMAADRYMSLKERIPMSFEYYATPSQKKEVVMYINPENMSISTAKVKQKVFTRGGIYFHHYGDDIWTMKISGTCGYAQMRGIEALEEIYFNSGTLLKYTNVAADTVHTNKITTATQATNASIQDSLDKLRSSGKVGNYLAKVFGTFTDGLGYTKGKDGKTDNSIATKLGKHGGLLGKIFNNSSSQKANGNLFDVLAGAAMDASSNMNKCYDNNTDAQVQETMNNTKNLMKAAAMMTGNPTAFKQYFTGCFKKLKQGIGSTTSKEVLGAMAADMVQGIFSGKPSNENMKAILDGMNNGTKNFFQGVLDMFNGDYQQTNDIVAPQSATYGNYYTLGQMTMTELNNVVKSVQSFNAEHTIDHNDAAKNWADIEDQLTDLYRPRQIIMYFDDRVYIGHFDSFNYTRKASTPLIYYDMSFTVTRQIKIDVSNRQQKNFSNGSTSLGSLLGTAIAGQVVGRGISAYEQHQQNKRNKQATKEISIPGKTADGKTAPTPYDGSNTKTL